MHCLRSSFSELFSDHLVPQIGPRRGLGSKSFTDSFHHLACFLRLHRRKRPLDFSRILDRSRFCDLRKSLRGSELLTIFIISAIVRRGRRFVHSITLYGPIEDVLVFKAATEEQVLKKFLAFRIIRCLFKLELTAVSHILCKFFWVSMAKLLNWCVDFALLNLPILVVLVARTEPLPRKLSLK